MKISLHTNLEYINTLLDLNSEDMPSKLLVGESKMEPLTGFVPTHGMKIGVTTDSSKFSEVLTTVESKDKSWQELFELLI